MERKGTMTLPKKRIAVSVAISLAIHLLLLYLMASDAPRPKPRNDWVALELVQKSDAEPEVSGETGAPAVDLTPPSTPRTEMPVSRLKRRVEKRETPPTSEVPPEPIGDAAESGGDGTALGIGHDVENGIGNVAAGGSSGTPSAGAEETGGGGHKQITLPNALKFSDFERLMGDTAEEERSAYLQKKQASRRNRGAFVSDINRVKAAMGKRESITRRAISLELGLKVDDAARYLATLHRKMEPHFSLFLTALDSPIEQLHKKVQQSPFKYNPFYVPPPDSERQASLNGPLSDLTLKIKTEFEILPTGELGEIRMIRSSNNEAFDVAAIDTLLKSAPFSPPPPTLISMNNRAYVQWTFFRDWKKNSPKQGRILLLTSAAEVFGEKKDGGDPVDERTPAEPTPSTMN